MVKTSYLLSWLKERKIKVLWGITIALISIRLLDPAMVGFEPFHDRPDWGTTVAHCMVIALIAGFLTWVMRDKN